LATEQPHLSKGKVPSAYVYDAVVDDGVASVKEFMGWLTAKKATGSSEGE
jgi:hypothetical protein